MLQQDCDPSDLQVLTDLDTRKLERLLEANTRLPESWRPELEIMMQGGMKCEIEAAHKLRGLPAFCSMLVEAMAMFEAL